MRGRPGRWAYLASDPGTTGPAPNDLGFVPVAERGPFRNSEAVAEDRDPRYHPS